MNKFFVSGKVYEEPVFSTTQSGKGLLRFKLSVGREFKNKETGKYEADFFNITAIGTKADYGVKNIEKGAIVNVECTIQNNNYTDSNGVKRYDYSFLANSIEVPYGRDAAMVMAEHANKKQAERQAANQNYSGRPDPQQLRQAQAQQRQSMEDQGFVEVVDDSALPF